MILTIESYLDYQLSGLTSAILQVEVAALPDQAVQSSDLVLSPHDHFARVESDGPVGHRVLLELSNRLECTYRARVAIDRAPVDLSRLPATPVHLLPGPVVRYLMGSRFCPSDRFQNHVAAEFGSSAGGARIQRMRDWIKAHLTYVPGESDSTTTALETFVQRRGVCRDFAHVMITLARASGIPARIASVYAPLSEPQDFHAVAEVFLDGGWHLVDATGMARPEEMARIGVGRDAADVSFLTVYGQATLIRQSVAVHRSG